jgi:hypothetical protein
MTFPSSPTNGQTTQKFGKKFAFNSTSGAWRPVSSPVVATVREPVATPAVVSSASGLPMTGNTVGKTAYVSETNRLYIWNGSGWFEMALINTSPTITTGGDATYELNSDGTPTVITLVANDPEGVPLTWSHAVTSGALEDTTVTNVDNVFTITPGTIAATFGLTFTASDGINIDTSASAFTLSFGPDWSTASLLYTLHNPNAYGTAASDTFGGGVQMSGDYAFINAQGEDEAGGQGSGKVYIYNVTTGALVKTLNNPNAYGTVASDNFPITIAISGNYLLATTFYEDDSGGLNSGVAYIFQTTTGNWDDTTLVHTLNNPNAYGTTFNDHFGYSGGISGNYCAVSARQEESVAGDDNSGRVYIFNVTTGALLHTLDNPNAYGTSAGDYFGEIVTMQGNYLMVGSRDNGPTNNGNGVLYIFKTTTGDWTDTTLIKSIDNPTVGGATHWTFSISTSEKYMVVGNSGELGYAGVTYIFKTTTGDWTDTALIHTLQNPDTDPATVADEFGAFVSISGGAVAISAFRESDASGTQSGKVYIFELATGLLLKTIDNPNAYGTSANDFFSFPAMSGNYLVVGAYAEDETGNLTSGKAYIFQAT